MGANFTATTTINDYIWDRFLIPEKFSSPPLFLSEFTGEIHSHETKMRAKYLEHIERVRKLVPPEKLLIWNVKEGWEPLCKFLGRPVPEVPIPHENKTGDLAFNAKYTYGNKFTQVPKNLGTLRTLLGLNDGTEEEFVRSITKSPTYRIYCLSGIKSSLVDIGRLLTVKLSIKT